MGGREVAGSNGEYACDVRQETVRLRTALGSDLSNNVSDQ